MMDRSRSLRAVFACALIAALTACGHRAPVNVRSAAGTTVAGGGSVILTAGTEYDGRLSAPIGTKTSHEGEAFTLTYAGGAFHNNPALQGTSIDGHVEDVRPAGPMRRPTMTIVFDDIRMPDGTTHPVDAKILSLNEFQPKSHHLRTIGLMIGGAIAGHMAAKHTGHKHGALAGAIGGYVLSQTLKTDIYVPQGSVVRLRLLAPVTTVSS
jgi:hypothetical protein